MAGNADFDTLLSTTLKDYVPKLVDNIFTARVLAFFLKEAGNMRMLSGGAKIVTPLIYALNDTAGSYSLYDNVSTTPQEGITAAEYDWKQYAATVAIAGIEEAKNNGEADLIDLLEAKIMQAEESITEGMNTMFHANGTGNSSKDWLGLKALIGNSTVNTASVGGIDASTETFWRSYTEATVTALTIAQMATAYNTVSVGNDQPTLLLTTQALYEKYESLLQPALRYADTKTADAGFQNLLYKGSKVCYDAAVTAGEMYFLNPKYIKLVGHTDKWFKPTPFVRPPGQDARYAQILCYGNLTISNRKRQGLLTGKS